ncbi:DNA transposase THAP9-like, partial [Paramuricea clavata]
MATLDQKNLILKELAEVLDSNFGHIDVELFKNEFKNNNLKTGSRYSKDIREFAISLNFYSPRAYKFVRKTLHLPHPATLRSWAGNVPCKPGFLTNFIKSLTNKLHLSGEKECALILDEMSIRKETRCDKKQSKFVGNINYGDG